MSMMSVSGQMINSIFIKLKALFSFFFEFKLTLSIQLCFTVPRRADCIVGSIKKRLAAAPCRVFIAGFYGLMAFDAINYLIGVEEDRIINGMDKGKRHK